LIQTVFQSGDVISIPTPDETLPPDAVLVGSLVQVEADRRIEREVGPTHLRQLNTVQP
jgi:hypothetical protein